MAQEYRPVHIYTRLLYELHDEIIVDKMIMNR